MTATAARLASLNIVVDKMHFKGHTDSWCHDHCNPYNLRELDKVSTNLHYCIVMKFHMLYICSAQFRNLRNLKIALRILRIQKLRTNLEIAHSILRLRSTFAQSRDCAVRLCNLEIARAQFANVMG